MQARRNLIFRHAVDLPPPFAEDYSLTGVEHLSLIHIYRRSVKSAWSIATVQGILDNDFYIGTLRQGKYTRAKINGRDILRDEVEQIVIENHHQPIIDSRTFATVRALREKRAKYNYRGVKINDNVYSGFLQCGDCGAPMFALGRRDLKPAYTRCV